MKASNICCLLIGLFFGFGVSSYIFFRSDSTNDKQIYTEIESLNSRLDTLKVENNTLIQRNDSIQVRIVKIKENYEETVHTILSNDVDFDYCFFTEYIDSYRLLRGDFGTAIENN